MLRLYDVSSVSMALKEEMISLPREVGFLLRISENPSVAVRDGNKAVVGARGLELARPFACAMAA